MNSGKARLTGILWFIVQFDLYIVRLILKYTAVFILKFSSYINYQVLIGCSHTKKGYIITSNGYRCYYIAFCFFLILFNLKQG